VASVQCRAFSQDHRGIFLAPGADNLLNHHDSARIEQHFCLPNTNYSRRNCNDPASPPQAFGIRTRRGYGLDRAGEATAGGHVAGPVYSTYSSTMPSHESLAACGFAYERNPHDYSQLQVGPLLQAPVGGAAPGALLETLAAKRELAERAGLSRLQTGGSRVRPWLQARSSEASGIEPSLMRLARLVVMSAEDAAEWRQQADAGERGRTGQGGEGAGTRDGACTWGGGGDEAVARAAGGAHPSPPVATRPRPRPSCLTFAGGAEHEARAAALVLQLLERALQGHKRPGGAAAEERHLRGLQQQQLQAAETETEMPADERAELALANAKAQGGSVALLGEKRILEAAAAALRNLGGTGPSASSMLPSGQVECSACVY
jgi:hypothetical protein